MFRTLRDTARGTLLDERDDPPRGPLVNLDERWRAAGRPIGRHPSLWAELASPLIAGLARYQETLSDISPRFPADPLLLRGDDPTGEGGDLLAHGVLADAYAAFLGAGIGPDR